MPNTFDFLWKSGGPHPSAKGRGPVMPRRTPIYYANALKLQCADPESADEKIMLLHNHIHVRSLSGARGAKHMSIMQAWRMSKFIRYIQLQLLLQELGLHWQHL